jgi:alkylated DNA nucleotide flippase Atl1
LVRRGEWTTYGDIGVAALGGRAARIVGRLAATHRRFPNAHRVLRAGGRLAADGHAPLRRMRLEAEGITFDDAGRADPGRRVDWSDLEARDRARARTGRSA